MTDKKISQLSAATTPLAGTEVLPIVQSSNTVKVATDDLTVKNIRSNATSGILQIAGPAAAATRVMTVPDANFTAARTDAAQSFTGDQTLSTGNLVVGTAAKGIDFSANTGAAGETSALLNWYEEGAWTPTIAFGGASTDITYSKQLGRYTRIGRNVTVWFDVRITSKGSVTGDATIEGLPFTVNADCTSSGIVDPITAMVGLVAGGAIISSPASGNTFIYLFQQTTTARNLMSDTQFNTTASLGGSLTYFV